MRYKRDIRDIRRTDDGRIFGVCSGIAHWAQLDARKFELIVFIIVVCTGFFPGALIYLALSLLIPMEGEAYQTRYTRRHHHHHHDSYESTHSSYTSNPYYEEESDEEEEEDTRSTEDLKKEYNDLKRKVEDMESQMFDKERDWDMRFHEDNT
ncbi:MAG: PspC domain-containing protein [Spirochaetia bacterium]|jgi:phage shock protein C|nr:PspC domain-containing protein [Spirochaetia bacterium]